MIQLHISSGSARLFSFVSGIFLMACGGSRSDEQMQQDINKQIGQGSGSSKAYVNVRATVNKGTVTLSGKCEGENCGDSLVKRIRAIDGIKEVVNNVQQAPMQTDYTLRTSVQSIISKYEGVQADVAAGNVVLRGTIQREQIQPLMNELSTLKARRIDNQLAIK